ncbi:MAG: hypothetical protein ABJC26_10660 [Gemmatimonadaceae bacterium]
MTHRRMRCLFFSIALLLPGCITSPGAAGPGTIVSRQMTYDGRSYPFVVYVPTTYHSHVSAPAVLLVHGGGGDGPGFIGTWINIAESKGIILVAPTLDLSAAAETMVPIVFPRLMDAAASEWNIDAARRYLFGYSAGGYFVYDAALLNANYFAGAGVFAAVIQPEYDSIARNAQRSTSIAIYLGDHDSFFSLQDGRRTRDLLLMNGMDVHYVELANQGHDYGAVSNEVNDDFWRYITSRPGR